MRLKLPVSAVYIMVQRCGAQQEESGGGVRDNVEVRGHCCLALTGAVATPNFQSSEGIIARDGSASQLEDSSSALVSSAIVAQRTSCSNFRCPLAKRGELLDRSFGFDRSTTPIRNCTFRSVTN